MNGDPIAEILGTIPIASVLWMVLGGTIIIFALYSSILLWHWKTYSTGKFTTVSNMFVYLSVSGGFILMMILAIVWFSLL